MLTDFLNGKLLDGSGGGLPQEIFFGFLLLKSPSWVSELFKQDIGKISTSKVFLLLKYIILTEMSPISVKRWKPVWMRTCILSTDVTGVACS